MKIPDVLEKVYKDFVNKVWEVLINYKHDNGLSIKGLSRQLNFSATYISFMCGSKKDLVPKFQIFVLAEKLDIMIPENLRELRDAVNENKAKDKRKGGNKPKKTKPKKKKNSNQTSFLK